MTKNKPQPEGFLLDTTALIDFLRGNKEVGALLNVLKDRAPLATCPITVAEVFAGAREKEMPGVEQLFSALKFYTISYSAARLAGSWRYSYARKGVSINLSDALIAAVAVENSLALVTANRKPFPMKGLIIIPH